MARRRNSMRVRRRVKVSIFCGEFAPDNFSTTSSKHFTASFREINYDIGIDFFLLKVFSVLQCGEGKYLKLFISFVQKTQINAGFDVLRSQLDGACKCLKSVHRLALLLVQNTKNPDASRADGGN